MEVIQTSKLVDDYRAFLGYSNIFIETGSCYGRSINLALEAGYTQIRSVEAKEEFYKHCLREFKDNPRVQLFYGKSVDQLPEMIYDLTQPAVFFLDAHVSGEASAGYQDWMEKQEESDYDQDKVLKAEIAMILRHSCTHLFIIDDQNGSKFYAEYIESLSPGKYKFELWDEQMGPYFYKNKMLIAIPL